MRLTKEDTDKISSYFKDKPILKAFVFGSHARGEANENSDLDLLIELDPDIPIGLEYAQYLLDLERLLARKVDLVAEKGLSRHVRPFVERDKLLFYEQS